MKAKPLFLSMPSLSIVLTFPKSVNEKLHRLCFGFSAAHWIDENCFHLTLIHFGKTEGNFLLDVQEKLSSIRYSPFTLTLSSINYSRGKQSSKGSLWVGTSNASALMDFKKFIDISLKELAYEKEKGQYVPHVTLGTLDKMRAKEMAAYFELYSAFELEPFVIDSFALLESRMTQQKTKVYQIIDRYFLKHE